jgi:hypothetical protein
MGGGGGAAALAVKATALPIELDVHEFLMNICVMPPGGGESKTVGSIMLPTLPDSGPRWAVGVGGGEELVTSCKQLQRIQSPGRRRRRIR